MYIVPRGLSLARWASPPHRDEAKFESMLKEVKIFTRLPPMEGTCRKPIIEMYTCGIGRSLKEDCIQ